MKVPAGNLSEGLAAALALLAILVAAALVGTAGFVGYGRSVEARIASLEASGRLPTGSLEPTPAARAVEAEFARLSGELERAIGSYHNLPSPACTRYFWDRERASELEQQVAAAEPVLAELDALLASQDAREIAESNARVLWNGGTPYPVPLGSLAWLRHWTNALNARAILCARRGDDTGAAASLASALALIDLADRGTVSQYFLTSAMRSIVTTCVEHVVTEESPSAAIALHEALEPRLRAAPTPSTIEACYATDVSMFVARTAAIRSSPFAVKPWERLTVLRELDSAARSLSAASFAPAKGIRGSGDDRWVVSNRHLRASLGSELRHTIVTRVTLALEAHRERTGAWPATLAELAPALGGAVPHDPVTGEPLRYEVGDDGMVLGLADVLREDYDGPDDHRTAFVRRRPVQRGR